jgi:HTH-type transcriptional regulator / antitoxin HigA
MIMLIDRIDTDSDYEAALARLDEIFNAKPGTIEGIEFEKLVDLIEDYENRRWPIP